LEDFIVDREIILIKNVEIGKEKADSVNIA
jgi:hypothetical protein